MPAWNENEYVKHAQVLAQQHVVSKKSLNDLSEKFAKDNALNPDEIRTLVRLANVATFQELFKKKDDGDKMIEFETGDPEAVIRRLVDTAGAQPQSANINNDKLAFEVPDQMREKRLGKKFDAPVEEKVASETSERAPRMDMVVLNMRKLAEEFKVEKIAAGWAWERTLSTLATTFKRAPGYGPKFEEFEKDAYAEYGMEVLPELTLVRDLCKLPAPNPDQEKVAVLQERHVTADTAEMKLLKTAMEARTNFNKFTNGLSWIELNMPALGK